MPDSRYLWHLKPDIEEGHEIVCDGYGYNGSTLYHHLNLGWSGVDTAWYNLPNIGTPYDFNVVTSCTYNVYPSGTGEIISGRVMDVEACRWPALR